MKILFLDIDGPMLPGRCFMLQENFKQQASVFDPVAVAIINRLVNAGVKLVISSVWRKEGYETFVDHLINNKIDHKGLHEDWRTDAIYSFNSSEKNRTAEILKWIKEHPEITTYAVLDDIKMSFKNMVHVDYQDGLLWNHIVKLHEIFGIDYADGSIRNSIQ